MLMQAAVYPGDTLFNISTNYAVFWGYALAEGAQSGYIHVQYFAM